MDKNLDTIRQLIVAYERAVEIDEQMLAYLIGQAIAEAARAFGISVEEKNSSYLIGNG